MTALRIQIHDKTVYEGPAIAVPRAGEEIHHDGQVVRVEALEWDFGSEESDQTCLVNVSITVGSQPYTY
jgi:hypothetical protein